MSWEHDDEQHPVPRPQRRTWVDIIRWWGTDLVVVAVALSGTFGSVVTGQAAGVSLGLAAVVVVGGTAALRARTEFRRGWREGHESAARLMLDWTNRRSSAAEVRAALISGDPTPEPWETHTQIDTGRGLR